MKRIAYIVLIASQLFLTFTSHAMNPFSRHPYSRIPGLQQLNDLEYPYETRKVQLDDGRQIAYADEGSGQKTILFIHGLGSYLPAWKKNIEGLKTEFRCIAIDLPGYGKSSKEPHSGMMTFYAGIVAEFIEKLGLQQVVIAGHSMGGQIGMVTALQYPDKVEQLILAAPAGFEVFSEGQKQWFRNVMTVRGVMLTRAEDIVTNLAYNFYNLPADAEFMITDRLAMRSAEDFEAYCYAVVQSVNGMVDEPVLNYLDRITQPVLIIFGENDNLIPNRFLNPGRTADVAMAGHQKIPNSQLVMLPKTGHFVQYESYERFNQAVISFLKPR